MPYKENVSTQPAAGAAGCARCRSLQVKCDYDSSSKICRRCAIGGHLCLYQDEKPRRRSTELDALMEEIRLSPSTDNLAQPTTFHGSCRECRARKIKCEYDLDQTSDATASCRQCARRGKRCIQDVNKPRYSKTVVGSDTRSAKGATSQLLPPLP
ncbi:hypothetical protein BDZ97DRAFT_183793 [Flammula alnicola]|nr:hypothetical protein BDZ97DRAFT_183793 [Flammula alnicola]